MIQLLNLEIKLDKDMRDIKMECEDVLDYFNNFNTKLEREDVINILNEMSDILEHLDYLLQTYVESVEKEYAKLPR